MKTVLECLEAGTAYLEERGIEDARRNMQWLVAHQLGCDRVALYTQFDRPLSEEELEPLREALKRRSKGEPLQHVLGNVPFLGQEYICDARALVPRPETEELADMVRGMEFPRPARVLDMGTGSGVLGLSLALALGGDCRAVVLVDQSPEALSLARENADKLGVEARFLESDLFTEVEGVFDLIVANLPYVPEGDRDSLAPEVGHDPPQALFSGADGLDCLRRFSADVLPFLSPGSLLALEVGHDQSPLVEGLLIQAGLEDVHSREDMSGISRFVFARNR